MSEKPVLIKPTIYEERRRILESKPVSYIYIGHSYLPRYTFDKNAGALKVTLKPNIKPKGAREIDADVLAIIGDDDTVMGFELLLYDKEIIEKVSA